MRKLDFAAFEERIEQPDGFGNSVADWVPRFDERVSIRYLRGSESVIAARLEGRQPVIITVRSHEATRAVSPGWRVKVNGVTYNIREPLRPTDQRKRDLEFLAESGVADG
jgi:SPP1 family predicted phage head-tail adaptor